MKQKVYDYFNKALLRPRDLLPPIAGEIISTGKTLSAQCFLEMENNSITSISYKCTTCMTQVAYMERLAEIALGISVDAALQISATDLVTSFPEVPDRKHDRAVIAVRALQSALGRIVASIA